MGGCVPEGAVEVGQQAIPDAQGIAGGLGHLGPPVKLLQALDAIRHNHQNMISLEQIEGGVV